MAAGRQHPCRYRRRRHGSDSSSNDCGGCVVPQPSSSPSSSSRARLSRLAVPLALLVLLALPPAAVMAARHDPGGREEAFIGWNGESYRAGGGAVAGGGGGEGGGAAARPTPARPTPADADAGQEDEGHAPGEGPPPPPAAPRLSRLSLAGTQNKDPATAAAATTASAAAAAATAATVAAAAAAAPATAPPRVEVLSWKPRAFLYRNFLNASEARHLQRSAARLLRRSTVVGKEGQSELRRDYRTSYGCFLRRRSDRTMEAVSRRASALVGIPELYAEDMQVLRYSKGQQYRAHMDSLRDDKAGPRVATLLLYLNDVARGGETAFPDAREWASPEAERRHGRDPLLSRCARGRVAARPRRGDALLFWSIKPDGETEDRASMHAGCPVEEGVKWTGTIWFHARPFREEWFNATRDPADTADPGDCADLSPGCAAWAEAGECERNPQYMQGDTGHLGRCRLSCKTCEPCGDSPESVEEARLGGEGAAADAASRIEAYKACRALNRHRAGYLVYDQDFEDPDDGVAAGLAALRRAGVDGVLSEEAQAGEVGDELDEGEGEGEGEEAREEGNEGGAGAAGAAKSV